MTILFEKNTKTFHLQSKNTSYIFRIVKNGNLAHLYWGKKVNQYNGSNEFIFAERSFSPNPDPENWDARYSLDTLPQEYPAYGNSDFRNPAYQVQFENGTTITDLRYVSHVINQGKPLLADLPATYVESIDEAETLEITLVDELTNLKVILSYTIFNDFNAITRSSRFVNEGNSSLKLLKPASMSLDFQQNDFDLITLPGAWARERHIERADLRSGVQSIESRRGTSSHQQNPFMALVGKGTDENHGEVFAFNLVYSGNFLGSVEVDQFSNSRVTMGINPFDFNWLLKAGESFQTPEVVMVYSSDGLGAMSRTYHHLYRKRLCRGNYRDKERPILINNWEATYFDFNEEKIYEIAKKAKSLGVELFVLDDGWFGDRNSDKGSLGDWYIDKKKIPSGLDVLADKINKLDMKFGLWFEPEMISPDSDLYREHPDWCIHVPERNRSEGRNQLILDFSREDVCEEIIKRVSDILEKNPISYVKWDMNRHMTETGSASLPPERQRETAHRYMLGVYKVMERITTKFPHILFESCSGGGGRFDPGMLYYMPQTWTSDNTDAVERLKIQYGTSLAYPIISMGSHVSAVPNHQVNRMTSMDVRGHVAMSGNLGYELDVTKLTENELQAMAAQIKKYKKIRSIIQFGEFYRLLSPFSSNDTSWIYVTENKTEAVFVYISVLAIPNAPFKKIKLNGLASGKKYYIEELEKSYYGDELMNAGLNINHSHSDFSSILLTLKEI
ncbi:alpha-galactosidase [Natronobacillus azotifigens]|uniref:Alpha-galactosidase n=1 Tax=Natronobacillus azotifigens TaxID=472978 RepID=A0A9J6RCT4_9BACI|nr:alpha-galactosidase [Natronobacillus azotifigens]MCZ0703108.1 alpha-galactosidase [Natronobacillus azotifigens]